MFNAIEYNQILEKSEELAKKKKIIGAIKTFYAKLQYKKKLFKLNKKPENRVENRRVNYSSLSEIKPELLSPVLQGEFSGNDYDNSNPNKFENLQNNKELRIIKSKANLYSHNETMDIFDLYSSAFGGLIDDGDGFSSSEDIILGKATSSRGRFSSSIFSRKSTFDSININDDQSILSGRSRSRSSSKM
ncbi:hypothetical protein AYI69_g494 [Smittium culicis]|uniref:Uncharacterized protein n=1 Tax=Smittium culicis TaxID=133412 RepID=A0A1R1YT56_9FUNG|nr:hypothetical protein AYI69_g494 [Smittium culicis]